MPGWVERVERVVARAPVDDAVSDNTGQGGDGDEIERGIASERQPCHLRSASGIHHMSAG